VIAAAGAAAQIGLLSRPAPGALARLGLAWPRVRLVVGYARWFASRARLGHRPEAGATMSVHAFTTALGPVFTWGTLELPLRASTELGVVRAAGFGTDRDRTQRGLWWTASLGTGLHWVPKALRGHGALVVELDAVAALARPRIVIDGALVHHVGPVGFRGAVLLEGRFP
jgi:hypothetical protein